ncbi:MAG: SMR family transporter [Trebonia sp.]|jgi:quaternary ammonium compound-resistance protein SugE
MAWVALVAAGLFETAFAVCLKLSDGLRVPWPTAGMIFLGDAVSTVKLVSIALILAGVVGLNLSGVTP